MSSPRVFDSSARLFVSLRREEEEKEVLVRTIGPHLTRVMQRGTATQALLDGLEDESCVSIVAQAEREDFQEFSPSNVQSPCSRSQLSQRHRALGEDAALLRVSEEEEDEDQLLQRRHRRKIWSRRRPEEGQEPPVIQGLWVQEIDWLKTTSSSDIIPPPPQFTDSCCHGNRPHRTSTGPGDSSEDSQDIESDSNDSDLTFDLMQVSGFNSSPQTEQDSDSEFLQSMLGASDSSDTLSGESLRSAGSDPVLEELRGRVTQIPKLFVSARVRDLVGRILDVWKTTRPANEGLLFHHLLRPRNQRYREGEEFYVLHHIQNGSYGDVFCVRDRSSGFTCAAKRVRREKLLSER
ncbi:uncharacterized protein LOC112450033 [Kryptolebias marmoratus]|uniref:uncharacterized protein LOC112450033 n=1 Tax=Kryptolebias marmoratus TaxID=37003 RepID=UPI000D52FBCE|nr:uncharacterized protein LOC112450033 [Kryptolebias marmoratus]